MRYKRKAEGTFVRSRVKWLEQGEKISHTSITLKDSEANITQFTTLILMVLLLMTHKLSLFFTIIFMLIFINIVTVMIRLLFFLDSLKNTNTISALEKEFCDQDIVLEEVVDSIKHLKCNKSPGNDGIAA